MHGAERKWVVNVDQYPGVRWYSGGVELLVPELRSGAQHGEVERPLATSVGQEAPVRRTGGVRSDKLMNSIHAADPDLATSRPAGYKLGILSRRVVRNTVQSCGAPS
jgi:hypothetical protein